MAASVAALEAQHTILAGRPEESVFRRDTGIGFVHFPDPHYVVRTHLMLRGTRPARTTIGKVAVVGQCWNMTAETSTLVMPGQKKRTARNLHGQAMGAKGMRTRARIVEVTLALLEAKRLRELRVAEIARLAEISSATFYLYFDDVIDVVLAAVHEHGRVPDDVLSLVAIPWPQQDAPARAEALVHAYSQYWDAHRTLFRVRNLAAEEGDDRFLIAREQSARAFLEALSERVSDAIMAGRMTSSIDPLATAGVLVAMLERLGAIANVYSDEFPHEEMIRSAAFLIASALAGGHSHDT
jgi:AcrR family transcriptional regulator